MVGAQSCDVQEAEISLTAHSSAWYDRLATMQNVSAIRGTSRVRRGIIGLETSSDTTSTPAHNRPGQRCMRDTVS